jgi:hypothetical protein
VRATPVSSHFTGHSPWKKLASAAGWRGHAEAGVLVSSFWDPTHDVLLTLPARRNQNLRSTYHLCGELACTPSGGSGGHGHQNRSLSEFLESIGDIHRVY